MSVQLSQHTYGKQNVRVSKIKRDASDPKQHEFIEMSVNVLLSGDFEDAYTRGDNRNVVATDTCKNTVYVVAKDDPIDTIESFGLALARHFVNQYAHVSGVEIGVRQQQWHRIGDCGHAFTGSDAEVPTTRVKLARDGKVMVSSGIDQLMVLKTTESGFKDFHRDEFRTLADTDDRILASVLTCQWDYVDSDADFADVRVRVRDALLNKFVDHYSRSVQETLMLMGGAAIDVCSEISSIDLTMPNKHHIPVNLDAFNRSNSNDVFVVTDEPSGFIAATITRDGN